MFPSGCPIEVSVQGRSMPNSDDAIYFENRARFAEADLAAYRGRLPERPDRWELDRLARLAAVALQARVEAALAAERQSLRNER